MLALGVLLVAARPWLDGDQASYVHVRWSADVSDETIRGLERRFALRQQQHDGASYGYDLLDPSPSNVRALLEHPDVEDTHDIDRERFAPAATAQDGDSRTGLAWRWGVEAVVPYVAPLGLILVIGGATLALIPWSSCRAALHGAAAAARTVSWQGLVTWIAGRVPVLGPVGFGMFRVAFAALLGLLVLHNGIATGALPLAEQRHLPIPFTDGLRTLAATPGGVGLVQRALLFGLVLFAAGVFARTVFVALAIGFNVWFCMWALSAGTHPLGILPLALIALVIVPWNEGIGVDRWRAPRATSRVPYGYAPWILALALGIGFAAAAFAKMRPGLEWVTNGSVRYHFMAESDVAMVDWGLWIAARPVVAVLVSLLAVVGEATVIVGAFARPAMRLLFGALATSLLAGFVLFHGAAWPAWWILLLGFLPWEWIDRIPAAATLRRPVHLLPTTAVVLAVLLAGQQVWTSWANREIPPFFSAYDMYSATFSSPEQFERVNGGPRFEVLARTAEREVDVGDCVRAEPSAIAEMEAALRGERPAEAMPLAQARATHCAGAIPEAGVVRVLADQREYDWTRGRAGYRYRHRLVAEWPLNP